jgi:disulfide bond formation protein DsbB
MYPLVVIIAAGLIMGDPKMKVYSLLLGAAGLGIAIYHNLLYYGIIPENIQPCSEGLSCTERQLELWGFITIPLLSLLSFVVVIVCLALYRPGKNAAD